MNSGINHGEPFHSGFCIEVLVELLFHIINDWGPTIGIVDSITKTWKYKSTYLSRYVSRVVKKDKKSFQHLTTFFMFT